MHSQTCIRSVFLTLTALTIVFAQSFTASLQGTITDSSGAVISNARVVLANEATNVKQEQRTTERGTYLFTAVPPGTYQLTVEASGFQTAVRTRMQLQV